MPLTELPFSLLCDKVFFPGNSVCTALVVLFSCLIFLKLSAGISKNQKTFKVAEKFAPFSFFSFCHSYAIFAFNNWEIVASFFANEKSIFHSV